MSGALSKADIGELLRAKPPLIEGWASLQEQLQPNGFELTVKDIASLQTAGTMAATNDGRVLSSLSPLQFNEQGFIHLPPGSYVVTFNEIIHLPNNVMALGRPRSSLLRCGADMGTAVWDAGYSGRSQSMLMVHNSQGFNLQKHSRVLQLVFFYLTSPTDPYAGKYQGENI